MRVEELVRREVISLRREDTLEKLVGILSKSPQDVFPVLDAQDRVIGTVGELDLVRVVSPVRKTFSFATRKLVREGLARDVEDVMTPRPATARLADDVDTALRRMESLELPQLVVVDEHNHLVGLIRGRDIYCALWQLSS